MNFSKTTSYAITVLSFMANHEEEKYSAKRLNERLKIPWPYLRQLLTKLSKSGFIFSTQGRNGGFQLLKPADQIVLAEIIDSVEGLQVLETCAMHEVWEETRENILNILNNTTLSHLLKTGKTS